MYTMLEIEITPISRRDQAFSFKLRGTSRPSLPPTHRRSAPSLSIIIILINKVGVWKRSFRRTLVDVPGPLFHLFAPLGRGLGTRDKGRAPHVSIRRTTARKERRDAGTGTRSPWRFGVTCEEPRDTRFIDCELLQDSLGNEPSWRLLLLCCSCYYSCCAPPSSSP